MPFGVFANITKWAGGILSPSTGVSPVGTEVAPVIRNIPLKNSFLVTNIPLVAGATYLSPWFDTNLDGGVEVTISGFANVGNGGNTFILQQSPDAGLNPSLTTGLGSVPGLNGVIGVVTGQVTQRYWRVNYLNGGSTQTSLVIYATVTSGVNPTPFVSYNVSSAAGGLFATAGTQNLICLNTNIGTSDAYTTAAGVMAPAAAVTVLPAGAFLCTGANGTGTWSARRTPNTFKTVSVAATATGNTAVWTPTAGKKFRLMKFQITAQGLAATATGVVTVSFQDAASGITIGTYDVDVPAVAGVVSGVSNISGGLNDIGNGFLSAAANNVLNFNISAAGAGTVGTYRINVCGTEE